MEKYQNKFRVPTARASWQKYDSDGFYFITICASERKKIFGEIVNARMVFSEIGAIAMEEWIKSFEIRNELYSEVFVFMPNHIHAILRIKKELNQTEINVETHGRASLQRKNNGVALRLPMSISSFVAGFKSSATKRINEFRNTPKLAVWQPRFHDRIVRNEEFAQTRIYIEKNVENWDQDEFYN
jgi:REP element-mobilizing transposase RayT